MPLRLILCVLLSTALEGVHSGWYRWLPGSMSRHRDSVAVAITTVAYGKWQGYASYRKVNRVLREFGLSVQKEDILRVGAADYFDVMTDPIRLDAALKAASTLEDPASEGMFYMQDEKGMAIFYIVAFALFGFSSSSWYWCYLLILSSSALVACAAFKRRSEVLFLLLAAVSANAAVARVLPTLPRIDINVIDGNRFIGIMASLAMFHLMLLAIYRVRPRFWQVVAAAFQTVIICLAVNARTSAAWLPISVAFLWGVLWFIGLVRRAKRRAGAAKPISWPILVLGIGLATLSLHQRFGRDATFSDAHHQEGHVFWHSLITALHNNPERASRYAIPPAMPVYDDQVGYILFDREIARRGGARGDYLSRDADWVYRTTSPELDFRWTAYDSVLRDVFLQTIATDPSYAADLFLVQQPKSTLALIFGPEFFQSHELLAVVPIAALVCGVLLAAASISSAVGQYVLLILASGFGAFLPVLIAAVMALRVIELFYVLLVATILAAAVVAGRAGQSVHRAYLQSVHRALFRDSLLKIGCKNFRQRSCPCAGYG